MMKTLRKIIKYKRLTVDYPRIPLDTRFITGCPRVEPAKCLSCGECIRRCPSKAVVPDTSGRITGINLDECIFCSLCADVCPTQAITMSQDFELAKNSREDLRVVPDSLEDGEPSGGNFEIIGKRVEERIRKIYGRSLQVREVDAGSCNGCDYEINALNNPFNDLERFGIHFVASPRHADMLLVTGPVSRNMEQALVKTYNATPDPKMVVAVGACATSGGIFRDNYATRQGIDRILPVDAYIPGCPPRPQAIIHGILTALMKLR